MRKKTTVGRKDKASFPELGLTHIDIKVDTGAYTSAMHCHKIEVTEIEGVKVLHYTLLDPSHPQYDNKEFSTDQFREKRIKNSFGISEKRFVIETKIVLFATRYTIELSLSRRGEMRFPILIGRRFLIGRFIVDPSQYDLSFKRLKAKNKEK